MRPSLSRSFLAAGIASALSSAALASPCDDGAEAWSTVDRAIDARDPATALRIVAPLLDARCHPSGAQREVILRAQLEGRLLQLETHAADVRADGHVPLPSPEALRGQAAYLRWLHVTVTPWVQQINTRLGALRGESDALVHESSAAPGIDVEAMAAVAASYQSFLDQVAHLPLPPGVEHDAHLREAFVHEMDELSEGWRDSLRSRYREVEAAARRGPAPSRAIRRADAWLAVHGGALAPLPAEPSASPAPAPEVPVPPVLPSSGAGLPADAIRRVVLRHAESIRACHERGLEQTPTLEGDLRVRFIIGPNGRVLEAQGSTQDAAMGPVAGCIAHAVSGWEFPPPLNGGRVEVTYPLQLRLDHSASASPAPSTPGSAPPP